MIRSRHSSHVLLWSAVVLVALVQAGCGRRGVEEKKPGPPSTTSGGAVLASPKFAGRWYGVVKLVDSARIVVGSSPLEDPGLNIEKEHEAYITLGKNSNIAVGAVVGGPSKNRLVETSTKILTPDHVQVKHEALLISGNGLSLWDEAETDMTLDGDTIEYIETHRVSKTPHATSYELVKYRGNLKRLSAAEAKALDDARKAAAAGPGK